MTSSDTSEKTTTGISTSLVLLLSWLFAIAALVFTLLETHNLKLRAQTLQILMHKVLSLIIIIGIYVIFALTGVGEYLLVDNLVKSGYSTMSLARISIPVLVCGLILYALWIITTSFVIPIIGIIKGFTKNYELRLPILFRISKRLVLKWAKLIK